MSDTLVEAAASRGAGLFGMLVAKGMDVCE